MFLDQLTSYPKTFSETALLDTEAEVEHRKVTETVAILAMGHQTVHATLEILEILETRETRETCETSETLETQGILGIYEILEITLILETREVEEVLHSLETHATSVTVNGKSHEAEAEEVSTLVAHLHHLIHVNVIANIHCTLHPREAQTSHLQETQSQVQVQPSILSEQL
jgi:hypothetical protein